MELSRKKGVARRRVLIWGLVLACAAVAGKLAGISLAFLRPPQKKGTFGGLVNAGSLGEIPEAGSAPRLVPQGRFWLVHGENGLRAIYNSCTHLQCLFGWDEEKNVFICPCHGSEFSRAGKVQKGPATRDLDCFPLRLVDDQEEVVRQVEEQADLAVADLFMAGDGEPEQPAGKILILQVDTGRRISGARGNG
jgi:cytochrome b6-f complex iron-sulfur subunit